MLRTNRPAVFMHLVGNFHQCNPETEALGEGADGTMEIEQLLSEFL